MSISVRADINRLGRRFEGIGGITSNGMTRLLRDYPVRQREEIMDYLFRPKFGASFHILKVEIGSDVNSTAGTEPSHMRAEDDFDITRGVGLWLARQAKDRNPRLLLDAIRWGTPRWITDPEKKYLYYKNFLDGARKQFGLEFDYLAPDENEGAFSPRWVTQILRPRLDRDGYHAVKLTGADSNVNWNIAFLVSGNPTLRKALSAISAHYHEDTPETAKTCGLPIFNSEDLAPYRHRFIYALEMAQKIIQSYAWGRMVQYQMHPIIEACYETTPYNYKGILTASQPWSGQYQIEPGLWVTAQFTQFFEPGWCYLDEGCLCAEEGGCLSLADPQTGDFSVVALNRSKDPLRFAFHLKHLRADRLHVWSTSESQAFVRRHDISVKDGCFEIELPAECIYTFTTTTGQQKGEFKTPPPSPLPFPLPYSDDFQSYPSGSQPRYAIDQGGAFEITEALQDGKKCLRQLLDCNTRPIDWRLRATPDPYTILGSPQLRNYQLRVNFKIEPMLSSCCDGYAMIGVRCNLAPQGNLPPECYNLCVFDDGQWQLRCGSLILSAGMIDADWTCWHRLQLRCLDDSIEARFDERTLVTVRDQSIPSGQAVLGCGYNPVLFRELHLEPLDQCCECQRYTALDHRLSLSGSWREHGCDANHFARTLLVSDRAQDSLQFTFDGTSVCIVGMRDKDCGQFKVELDGETYEGDAYYECPQYRRCLFSRSGMQSGKHFLRLTTTGGKSTISSGIRIGFTAVETAGGRGLL